MKYMILDNETETHHSLKRKSNPFDPRNWIVMRGFKVQGDKRCSMQHFPSKASAKALSIPDDVDMLVGHNIKFDLLYEMCTPGGYEVLRNFYARGGRVWDTQYVEYLINAQSRKYQMVAMDDIIEDYGGRKKIDGLKALWASGVLTSEINPDVLEDYLIGTEEEGRNSGDIGNTELIFLGQQKAVAELGMTNTVRVRMDGLCATTEMEYNGLKIDIATAREDLKVLAAEQAEVAARLNDYISKLLPEDVEFKWGSPVHVSCLLFGGTIKYSKQAPYVDIATGDLARFKAKADWPVFRKIPRDPEKLRAAGATVDENGVWSLKGIEQDTYISGKKIGQPKTVKVDVPGEIKVKYQDFFVELPGITSTQEMRKSKLLDGAGGPVYSTDKDAVELLGMRDIPFLKDFSRNAALDKEIGTYYVRYDARTKGLVGMLTAVDPETGIVHHSLNHTSTVTTRLSSNNPNMQNIPRSDKSRVKAMFVSRFGDDGEMVEVDYSQLEVVIQALLSGDTNLIKDLRNKVDFHCKRVALKNNVSYDFALFHCKNEDAPDYEKWHAERTSCKEFSFQRAYGAGAASVAHSTGMDVDEIKLMIEKEEAEYPGVPRYNNAVMLEVQSTAEPYRDPEREFKMYRKGYYTAITGTRYEFKTYDAPKWAQERGETDTFMPTELKNYPIQGTGGEVVQLSLGVLWRAFVLLRNFDSLAFLVNTVHDCIWADTHKSVTAKVVPLMTRVMESIPDLLKRHYGIDCPVPFPTEAKCGPNMHTLKNFHV